MYWNRFRSILLPSVTALGACCATVFGMEPMVSVNAADISKRVAIIGMLQKPLGTVVEVKGVWEKQNQGPKNSELFFRVTDVDGKRLDNISFPAHRVEPIFTRGNDDNHASADWTWIAHATAHARPPLPKDGEVWELRGYETGGFLGYPDDVLREFDTSLIQSSPESGFVTKLIFVKMKKSMTKPNRN